MENKNSKTGELNALCLRYQIKLVDLRRTWTMMMALLMLLLCRQLQMVHVSVGQCWHTLSAMSLRKITKID